MKKLLTLLCLMMLGLAASASAGKLTVQGHLANHGVSTDGWHVMQFSFYSDSIGGTSPWTETDSVFVQGGLFTAILGRANSIPDIVFGGTAWLETTVDGLTLAPRIGYYPQPVNIGAGQWQGNADDFSTEHNVVATPAEEGWSHKLSAEGAAGRFNIYTDPSGSGYLTTPGLDKNIYSYGTLCVRDAANINQITLARNGTAYFSGDVGIGISNPEFSLDVQTTDYTHGFRWFVNGGTENGSYVQFGSNNARGAFYIGNASGDYAALQHTTGGWQWNRQLNLMGNVGINTTNTTSTLTVNGSGEFGGLLGVGGDLNVNGNLTVNGTKCRVVDTDRYGQVKMNATESGHALFMDDGQSAKLVNGRCRVELNPKFLATVTVDKAHPLTVSVTFYGPHGDGWYVERDLTGFYVIDRSGSDAEFSWTVTARQKGYADTYLEPAEAQTASK